MADADLAKYTETFLRTKAEQSVMRLPGAFNDKGWPGYSLARLFSEKKTLVYAASLGKAREYQVEIWRRELRVKRRSIANVGGGVGGGAASPRWWEKPRKYTDEDFYGRPVSTREELERLRELLMPKPSPEDGDAGEDAEYPRAGGCGGGGVSRAQATCGVGGCLLEDRREEDRPAPAAVSSTGGGGTHAAKASQSAQSATDKGTEERPGSSKPRKRTLEEVRLSAKRLVFHTRKNTARALPSDGASVHARNGALQLTAMQVAVRRGLRVVNSLLARGVNPNQRGVGGSTALHAAALLGDDGVAEALLISGGDPDALDSRGESPLIKAVRCGHGRVAATLITAGCDVGLRAWAPSCFSALDRAAEKGYVDIINLLLKNGADITATDARGNTAMHVAACYGQLGAIGALIDAGASVSAKNADGLVPIMLAPNPSPAELALLARGAAKNAALGLHSVGFDVGVQARRVRLRLSPSAFSVAPIGPGVPAGCAHGLRYKLTEG